jgi:Spy/CpxP family protein refolding chaperone
MKRIVCAALAAALLVPGSWALKARAHDEKTESSDSHHDMADKAKEKLGLTDDQSAKFKDAMKAHRDEMKPIHEKMKDGIKKLHEQVKAKASDEDIKATLASLKTSRQDMTAAQEKFHESLAAFLTPTQQAKLVLGMAKRMHEGMEHGHRHGKDKGSKDKDDDHEDDEKGE